VAAKAEGDRNRTVSTGLKGWLSWAHPAGPVEKMDLTAIVWQEAWA
jgi:hypothetical protein